MPIFLLRHNYNFRNLTDIIREYTVHLPNPDRFSCSKSHLHFKMAFEKIGPSCVQGYRQKIDLGETEN